MNIISATCDHAYRSVVASCLLLDLYIESYFQWDLPSDRKADADELIRLLSQELKAARTDMVEIMESF